MQKLSLFLFSLVFSISAYAAEKPYISHNQLNIIQLLPNPVANGSAEDKIEQEYVLAAQKNATSERIALANADAEETVFAMFKSILGPEFNPDKLPETARFFERIGETEDAIVDPAKAYFGRTRPFLNNPDIQAKVKPSKSGSYPSGHTSRSRLMAIILSIMVPEKRNLIFIRADDYAYSRIIGGMHYPNDLVAGKLAGTAMAVALLPNSDFQNDMKKATTELRTSFGL